ncbi:MAG TPA: hypothetical protein VMV22_09075 [Acidimicrobiales bacterium]|nr:hypothetical protein [Acidimicrobiales bacterium]
MAGRRVTLATCAVVLLLTAAAPVAMAAPHKPKTAVLYGDSLLWETTKALMKDIRKDVGWRVVVRAVPATAPCDWLPQLQRDIARFRPTLVGLESAGASWTRCMIDPATGGHYIDTTPAWVDKYTYDLDAFFRTVTGSGVRMMFIAPPPTALFTAVSDDLVAIADVESAKFPGASVARAPALAVTVGGKFTWTLPCMGDEGTRKGCESGRIAVRNSDGLHFCPRPWGRNVCPGYSSGEMRFAAGIAASIGTS